MTAVCCGCGCRDARSLKRARVQLPQLVRRQRWRLGLGHIKRAQAGRENLSWALDLSGFWQRRISDTRITFGRGI